MTNTKYPLSQEEFKSIYSRVPRLTVEILYKTEDGILLTKRSIPPYVGSWHIPGGTVYYRETLDDAAKRVAKNELGLDVTVGEFQGFIHYPNLLQDQGWDWPIGAAFLVERVGGELRGSDQGEELEFFRELPERMVPSQGEFLVSAELI